jgi:deoxyribonuclease V
MNKARTSVFHLADAIADFAARAKAADRDVHFDQTVNCHHVQYTCSRRRHSVKRTMITCVDAAYGDTAASAACVIAASWRSASPLRETALRRAEAAPYEPGSFYRRELPLLRAVLEQATPIPEIIIIDGYVWLDANGRPGLGAHLYEELGGGHVVIGVAKTAYRGADDWSALVMRGRGGRPLFVTAAGMTNEDAAAIVAEMHGSHRIPTLVRRADQLARRALGG